jgi:hypothetical protein
MSKPLKFKWSQKRREYVYGNHRTVQQHTLKRLVSEAIEVSEARMGQLAEKYRKGRIARATWKMGHIVEMQNLHTAVAILATGGVAQMKPASYVKTSARLRAQLRHLDRFDRKEAKGLITDDRKFIARAASYAGAGMITFENLTRQREQKTALYEQRILGSRKTHCGVCKEQADLGKQPKGVLKEIGDSPCRGHCDCTFMFFEE